MGERNRETPTRPKVTETSGEALLEAFDANFFLHSTSSESSYLFWQLTYQIIDLSFKKELMKIFQPLFISLILKYFNGTLGFNDTMIYAGVFSVFASIGGILHHPYYYNSYVYGMRIRLALAGLIYRKVNMVR